MEITLKQAFTLQQDIIKGLDELKSKVSRYTTLSVDKFTGDLDAAFNAQQSKLQNIVDTFDRLEGILTKVRIKTGKANEVHGIDDILSKEKGLKRKISLFQSILNENGYDNSGSFRGVDVLKQQVADLINRANADNRYLGSDTTVSTSILTEEDKDDLRDQIRTLEQDAAQLRDKASGININQRIFLDEEVVAFLKEQKIPVGGKR